jgi:hypothetical protein
MEFQQTVYFIEKAKHRFKIEAKNSELKMYMDTQGPVRKELPVCNCRARWLFFTVNLKKILKIMN